jgi:hypothetical protein
MKLRVPQKAENFWPAEELVAAQEELLSMEFYLAHALKYRGELGRI